MSAQHGTVESVALINDRDTGRPRGFGFVEMPSADAARAIQSLNSVAGKQSRFRTDRSRPVRIAGARQ